MSAPINPELRKQVIAIYKRAHTPFLHPSCPPYLELSYKLPPSPPPPHLGSPATYMPCIKHRDKNQPDLSLPTQNSSTSAATTPQATNSSDRACTRPSWPTPACATRKR